MIFFIFSEMQSHIEYAKIPIELSAKKKIVIASKDTFETILLIVI